MTSWVSWVVSEGKHNDDMTLSVVLSLLNFNKSWFSLCVIKIWINLFPQGFREHERIKSEDKKAIMELRRQIGVNDGVLEEVKQVYFVEHLLKKCDSSTVFPYIWICLHHVFVIIKATNAESIFTSNFTHNEGTYFVLTSIHLIQHSPTNLLLQFMSPPNSHNSKTTKIDTQRK